MPGLTGGLGGAARTTSLRAHFGTNHHANALATMYFALFRGYPGQGGSEPVIGTGGYARVALANTDASWGTISTGQFTISNAVAIVWPVTTALYSVTVPMDFWAVLDAASAGNLWYYGPLTTPIQVTAVGDTPRIPAGALSMTVPE